MSLFCLSQFMLLHRPKSRWRGDADVLLLTFECFVDAWRGLHAHTETQNQLLFPIHCRALCLEKGQAHKCASLPKVASHVQSKSFRLPVESLKRPMLGWLRWCLLKNNLTFCQQMYSNLYNFCAFETLSGQSDDSRCKLSFSRHGSCCRSCGWLPNLMLLATCSRLEAL